MIVLRVVLPDVRLGHLFYGTILRVSGHSLVLWANMKKEYIRFLVNPKLNAFESSREIAIGEIQVRFYTQLFFFWEFWTVHINWDSPVYRHFVTNMQMVAWISMVVVMCPPQGQPLFSTIYWSQVADVVPERAQSWEPNSFGATPVMRVKLHCLQCSEKHRRHIFICVLTSLPGWCSGKWCWLLGKWSDPRQCNCWEPLRCTVHPGSKDLVSWIGLRPSSKWHRFFTMIVKWKFCTKHYVQYPWWHSNSKCQFYFIFLQIMWPSSQQWQVIPPFPAAPTFCLTLSRSIGEMGECLHVAFFCLNVCSCSNACPCSNVCSCPNVFFFLVQMRGTTFFAFYPTLRVTKSLPSGMQ